LAVGREIDETQKKWACTVQGIDVGLDTDLELIHASLRGPDRFSHLVFSRAK